MTNENQGIEMDNPEDKGPPSEKELGPTANNEFAPNIVAGKEVAPAPSPKPSKAERKAAARAARDQAAQVETAAAPADEPAPEQEFLAYVHGDLTKIANELGYDVVLKKRNTARGPVMLYHRETREGQVFNAREEAGNDFMSGDELQQLQADEASE